MVDWIIIDKLCLKGMMARKCRIAISGKHVVLDFKETDNRHARMLVKIIQQYATIKKV